MPLPEWWRWETELTRHFEARLEEHDLTEIDLRTYASPSLSALAIVLSGALQRWSMGNWMTLMKEDPFRLDPVLTEALRAAAEYARYLGSSSVDTEHVLLGFLRAGDAVFRGVSNTALRERILEKVQRGTPVDPSRELPFAGAAVKALGLPVVSGAEVPPINLATPGDVLFAILNESDSLAGGVLRSAGVTSRDQINLR